MAFGSIIFSSKKFGKYLIIYYIGGITFSIASSIELFWFYDNFVGGDEHFFINAAIDFHLFGIRYEVTDYNYFFYKLFVYFSSPAIDYQVISIFSKVNFTLIWGIVLYLLFNQDILDLKEKVVIILLIFIGWFYSTYVLRDGFVAIGFLLFFGGLSRKDKSYLLTILGFCILCVTRIQIPILFIPCFVIFIIIKNLPIKVNPAILISLLMICGLIGFKLAPIPQTIITPLAITLLPHGETAEKASPIPKHELALIYYKGDQKAKDTIAQFWVSRFPSIFYEPNPFRYFFWPFMGILGSETVVSMIIKAISSISSLFFLSILLCSFLISKDSFYNVLGNLFLFLFICLLLVGSIYAIKYFGMTTRIYFGFIVGFLAILFYRPVSNAQFNYNFYPVFFILIFFNFLYFFVKPFDWLWNYL
ncbi:hypothetical protein [Cyclobacterium jeungdonense]|uniref:Glycosyltransferase RgtA/B/C/D-like domain-containing protein n=1 Tax=Cyclobacterium jeungdonense TaxID=708087 RepID=A0ABT8C148_9BACT|nr:hypothetical protein [Cyclobacterium jeungdonense]MDN3686524.1 hypothetical protein [Cyclobacterium jeungdonense]